ncbi:LysM peptidoglycan-binding domain-containing protein [Pseudaestuariivita sp.]|uniref:LysM peptidoglycan-binding domain-containing protein n=1 Tax=Pseudaestuariivita sp. TaxID=2211669 RepID=UPI00405993C6
MQRLPLPAVCVFGACFVAGSLLTLTLVPAAQPASVDAQEVSRTLSAPMLASAPVEVAAAPPTVATPVPTAEAAMRRSAAEAWNDGASPDEIDALLNKAVRDGVIDVPDGLMAADGSIDTRTLLFDIVTQAVARAEASQETALAPAPIPAALETPAALATAPRTYVVQAGDSLAYISLKLYGSFVGYERIFEANRNVLSDPNRLSIGQELRIPDAG